MKMNRHIRNVFVVAGAACMTIAPALSMAVQRKLRPDAMDIGGFIYQMIGRTINAIELDAFTATVLFIPFLWLAWRYLFHKPQQTKVGEYLLAFFLGSMMLCSASIRATGSVQTLYENGFQVFKALLFLLGMTLLFLCILRGLNDLLNHQRKTHKVALWHKHPFAFPFAVLFLVWLPQILIKYPGVLMIDSCLQFREYLNMTPRSTTHPPFGTLIYGLMMSFGMQIGNKNLILFIFMLGQVFSMIAVLSYCLYVMRRENVPHWVMLLTLLLFGLTPNYIGWAVVIVKDSAYLILCLLAGVMVLDYVCSIQRFLQTKWKIAVLLLDIILMILTRHNGISIAIPMLLAMGLAMLFAKLGRRQVLRFALLSCLSVFLALGANEAIIQALQIKRVTLYDWLSIPFQQTARVTKLHGAEIPAQEGDAINRMLDYSEIGNMYQPNNADPVKWTAPGGRTTQDRDAYLSVWFAQMQRYPMDYVDALLNMNIVLFDLQSNFPVFIGLSDNSLYHYVYPYSFNDMTFYESEAIRPLNSLQMALTEWYFRFSSLPVVGLFASMGFCVDCMIMMLYLAWVNHRRRMMIVYIPSVIVAISGLFCPIVYTRYLLTTICSLPLWLAAYYANPASQLPHTQPQALTPDQDAAGVDVTLPQGSPLKGQPRGGK